MYIRRGVAWLIVCCCIPMVTNGMPQQGSPAGGTVLALATPEAAPMVMGIALGGTHPGPEDGPGGRALLGSLGPIRPLLRHPPADPALASALGLDRTFVVGGGRGSDLAQIATELRASGLFESVEVNRVASLHSVDDPAAVPDDRLFGQQYALHNTGQSVGGQIGLPGADIDAIGAWGLTQGSHEVLVAVFDAGVSQSHPDLAPKLVAGWDFMNDSADTDDGITSHGTHTAGIVAAMTANRAGIAGVSWKSKLMPIVVLNKYGFGNESDLAEGLVWAADQGAEVGSVSLGFDPRDGGAADQTLRAAVSYATARGMLICASAGNVPGAPIGAPARYPETIAVGATDNRDELWAGTSTGPEMSVVAPGVSILSTWDSTVYSPGEDTYALKTGTSQACPHVAGLAALVRSVAPRLRPAEIKQIIEQTAADKGEPGWDAGYGFGRIDAAAAVLAASRGKGGDPASDQSRCVADFNGDHHVDSQDLVAYLNAFLDHNWRADLAEPFGLFDTRDLLEFLQAYAAGCQQ